MHCLKDTGDKKRLKKMQKIGKEKAIEFMDKFITSPQQ
jgi:hypothetical protein